MARSATPPRNPDLESRSDPRTLPPVDDRAEVERLSRMFRALGDPTRSRMVLALLRGELCVTDLAERIGQSLSATSHQLRTLRDLNLVRVRRDGKHQYYVLNEGAFGFCSPRSCHAWRSVLHPEDPGQA